MTVTAVRLPRRPRCSAYVSPPRNTVHEYHRFETRLVKFLRCVRVLAKLWEFGVRLHPRRVACVGATWQ